LEIEGRKSHAELNPELVPLVRQLRRRRPKGGQRSLREISVELAARGFMNERGSPFCGFDQFDVELTAEKRPGSRDLLPPSPPAQKTSACKDQAGQEADLSGLFGKRLGLAQNIIKQVLLHHLHQNFANQMGDSLTTGGSFQRKFPDQIVM
jgi:hypothetical protein